MTSLSAWAAPVVMLDEYSSVTTKMKTRVFVGMALAHDEWRSGLERHSCHKPFQTCPRRGTKILNALTRRGDIRTIRWFAELPSPAADEWKLRLGQPMAHALKRDWLDVAEFFLGHPAFDHGTMLNDLSTAWTRLDTLRWICERFGVSRVNAVMALEHACSRKHGSRRLDPRRQRGRIAHVHRVCEPAPNASYWTRRWTSGVGKAHSGAVQVFAQKTWFACSKRFAPLHDAHSIRASFCRRPKRCAATVYCLDHDDANAAMTGSKSGKRYRRTLPVRNTRSMATRARSYADATAR